MIEGGLSGTKEVYHPVQDIIHVENKAAVIMPLLNTYYSIINPLPVCLCSSLIFLLEVGFIPTGATDGEDQCIYGTIMCIGWKYPHIPYVCRAL